MLHWINCNANIWSKTENSTFMQFYRTKHHNDASYESEWNHSCIKNSLRLVQLDAWLIFVMAMHRAGICMWERMHSFNRQNSKNKHPMNKPSMLRQSLSGINTLIRLFTNVVVIVVSHFFELWLYLLGSDMRLALLGISDLQSVISNPMDKSRSKKSIFVRCNFSKYIHKC